MFLNSNVDVHPRVPADTRYILARFHAIVNGEEVHAPMPIVPVSKCSHMATICGCCIKIWHAENSARLCRNWLAEQLASISGAANKLAELLGSFE